MRQEKPRREIFASRPGMDKVGVAWAHDYDGARQEVHYEYVQISVRANLVHAIVRK